MGRNKLLVLWVEDDPNDVLLLQRAFKKVGISPVHICPDGEEAIRYLKGKPPFEDREKFPLPNLIVTDIKMPRASGLDLLRWLHDHPRCCVLPVVLFSGSGQDKDVQEAYKLGASGFFQKPTKLEEAVNVVEKILNYWREAFPPAAPDGRD